ncbi:MAG: hypothetical protein WBI25_03945 [Smithellaceae bacterium]|jgi:hypothetical protein
MKNNDIKILWNEKRQYLDELSEKMKDSMYVTFSLLEMYDKSPEEEKPGINEVLADWLLSDDGKARYDARFIIGERVIKSLKSTVEKAIALGKQRSGPSAIDEVEVLENLLNELK